MDYWIAIDTRKIGPLPLDEVVNHPVTPETLVWRDGLPTWVPAGSLPELAEAFGWDRKPPVTQPMPAGAAFMPPVPSPVDRQPLTDSEIPPMPPTYLGWCIAAIICCCMIPAIVALIYSVRVSSLYNSGDFKGAQKASDRTELWLIIAITLGLLSLPFMIVMQVLAA